MRLLFIATIAFITLFAACKQDGNQAAKGEKTVEEIKSESQILNSQVVRNPVGADVPEDTINVAKIVWKEPNGYDFGKVKEGEIVEHTFEFTNSGKVPLVISAARSTCGCTVPEKPEEPVGPGEKGEIKVKFNTKGKRNQQRKPIIVTANTYPKENQVMLSGVVESAENSDKPTANN